MWPTPRAVLAASLLLSAVPAAAAPVRGTVAFADESQGVTARHATFWRVPNGVLPLAPPLHDLRAEAVVVLYPQGAVTGAQVAAAEEKDQKGPARAEVVLQGRRAAPAVVVVAPGTEITLRNEDRVEYALSARGLSPQRVPASGKVTFAAEKPGEYVLRAEDPAHLTVAVLVAERAFSGRVDPDGTFAFEAPEGDYEARLFWRGAFVARAPLQVAPKVGAELSFKGPLPGPAAVRR
jgi:plastocyanin